MKRIVRKMGGSLQITLTPYATEELELKEGDTVDVRVKNKEIIIKKVKGDK